MGRWRAIPRWGRVPPSFRFASTIGRRSPCTSLCAARFSRVGPVNRRSSKMAAAPAVSGENRLALIRERPVDLLAGGRSAKASNRPCSAMSFAARMKPPQAAERARPRRDALDAEILELASCQSRPADEHVDRQFARDAHDLGDLLRRSHQRRVKHVGAGFRVSGEARAAPREARRPDAGSLRCAR